ncbi:hypothetical protein AJ79_05884 [Helicocarpus griseus UAMH5409]|uniref:Fe2OG dioxygenase domain-containing protein n=1 Tax=Helicocarpus griseus UAMH5409 TaxID=1447875 RepID=A0A2B7XIM7_9EURO|nr:hypothetical protein AJ79_05884 [Helicocarpus griseus UAMH5409]
MFPASSLLSNLPNVPERKALLILDLQNDFVKPDGALFVRNVPDFLDTVALLAQRFRETGDVVWVQTQFDHHRPIFNPDNGGEMIVVDRQSASDKPNSNDNDSFASNGPNNGGVNGSGPSSPAQQQRRRNEPAGGDSRRDQPSPYPDDPEAFLSVAPKSDRRRCCQAKTAGCQFPAPILSAIDHERDTVLVKSDYSAFQSESLLLSFRTSFVRELYICGSLSNVSVYATALDAVSHGLDVTLVEDCLGFRSFSRHEEAMRRMADMMGVNGITSKELTEEQDWEEAAIPPSQWPEQAAASTPVGIEADMDVLAVESPKQSSATTPSDRDRVSRVETPIGVAKSEEEEEDESARLAIAWAASRSQEAVQDHGPSDGKLTSSRPRMRRNRRTPSRDEKNNSEAKSHDTSAPPGDTPSQRPRKKNKHGPAELGPDDSIGDGDSRIVYDLALSPKTFQNLREEVNWQKMYHMSGQVPRLVAVQGAVQSDGSVPIYRHPADESPALLPFSKTVNTVRQVVEKHLGHPLNHVLIQLYRDGQDRISEHSDKTLDIVRGSYICNVSLGAQRTMTLRTKSSAKSSSASAPDNDNPPTERQTQKVPLPHNSLFILGEQTNMRWLHAIRADKRPDSEKSSEELAYNGERISLTFRHIGTFINPEIDTIWGQGAVSKTQPAAGKIVHGASAETDRMIKAFGQENQQSEFDWADHYGQGFDVVNFVTTSAGKLLPSGDGVADLRVKLCFVENGVRYDVVSIDDFPTALRGTLSLPHRNENQEPRPVYMDVDGNTCITGDDSILMHVAKQKGLYDGKSPSPPPSSAAQTEKQRPQSKASPAADSPPETRHPDKDSEQEPQTLPAKLASTNALLRSWRRFQRLKTPHGVLQNMDSFEALLRGKSYFAGQFFGVEDCALWPIVRDIIHEVGGLDESRFPAMRGYYSRVGKRACVRALLEEMMEAEKRETEKQIEGGEKGKGKGD